VAYVRLIGGSWHNAHALMPPQWHQLHPYLYHVPLRNANICHSAGAYLAVFGRFARFEAFFGNIQIILLIL